MTLLAEFTPENFVAGDAKIVTTGVKVPTGNKIPAHALMKRLLAITSEADAGNTGNGTIDATIGTGARIGAYSLECIEESAGAGKFAVYNPEGTRLHDLTAGVEYVCKGFTATITAGGTEFVVGDIFTLSVTDSDTVVQADGPDNMFIGLAPEEIDATTAAKGGVCWQTGQFFADEIVLPDTVTIEEVSEALRSMGIHAVNVTTA